MQILPRVPRSWAGRRKRPWRICAGIPGSGRAATRWVTENKIHMKKSIILWILQRVKKRIPLIVFMVITSIISALLSVAFALGSRDVIDTAIEGAKTGIRDPFIWACAKQLGIIIALLICLTLNRQIRERFCWMKLQNVSHRGNPWKKLWNWHRLPKC